MGKFKDLTEQQFGRLIVIERAEDGKRYNGKPQVMWLCECQCEERNRIIVSSKNLLSGYTKSCGCLHADRMKEVGEKLRELNRYDLTGEYGIGYTKKGEEFYFDLEDYDLIKNYTWRREIKGGYIVTVVNGKHIKMHNLVSNLVYVDHKNRKTNDNRKQNLRQSDSQTNEMNKTISVRNKSGVVGVSFSQKSKKWIAQIKKDNIHKTKYFKNKDDAIKQRLLWEKELFKDWAGQRNLWKEYGIE